MRIDGTSATSDRSALQDRARKMGRDASAKLNSIVFEDCGSRR